MYLKERKILDKVFLDNKELKMVPSPFDYQDLTCLSGQNLSKYKSVALGNSSLQSKN